MKSKLLLLGILVLVVCAVIFLSNYVQQSTDETRPAIEMIYREIGGLASADNSLTIKNDGRLIYTEKDYSMEKPLIRKLKLFSEELEEFKKLILEADVFGFEDVYYSPSLVTDMPSSKLEIKIDGRTKSIFFSQTIVWEETKKRPEELKKILSKISEFRGRFE